jgi:hypothetical protein
MPNNPITEALNRAWAVLTDLQVPRALMGGLAGKSGDCRSAARSKLNESGFRLMKYRVPGGHGSTSLKTPAPFTARALDHAASHGFALS